MIKAFLDTGALLQGHFKLRSGLHSGEYFQCALVLQHPAVAGKMCRALAEKIRAGMGPGFTADGVIAPALGGLVVGHEIARELGVRFIFAEKQDNRLVMRRGFKIRAGERFVVAEDVITRGGRVDETIAIVEAAGGVAAAIGVLVDRSGGKASFKPPVFSLLKMEPVTYEPGKCPLCAKKVPMDHPGS